MKHRDPNAERREVPIRCDGDIVEARLEARALAALIGFHGADLVTIATAVSEVARNIIEYAQGGEVILNIVEEGPRRGMQVIARDQGPGIPDLAKAMEDGFSTSRGLGLGLPGAQRLMDVFEIRSTVGYGTTVMMRKWLT